MNTMQKGFTLIELMIVVAIIGISQRLLFLLTKIISLARKVTAGLAEINPGKTQFEVMVNDGASAIATTDIGLQASTQRCTIATTYTSTSGVGTIVCTLAGTPSISAKTVGLKPLSNRW